MTRPHLSLTRRFAALLACLTLLGGLAIVTPGAQAQSVEDKRAEAEAIATEVEQLRIQASQLDEQYHQATLELEEAQQAVLDAEGRVAELEAAFGVARGELQDYAVEAYMGGDAVPSIDTFLESDEPNQVGIKVAYLSNATNDRQDILDALHGAQAALDAEVRTLEQAQAEAAQLEATARTAREGARQAVADEEAIYARVQGELADLVAEEEARRAAETQRRAEEAARRAAEEAAQAAPPAAPTQDEVVELNEDPPTEAPTTTAPPTQTPEPTEPTEPIADPGGATPGAGTAVSAGLSQVGVPYVWAGSSPETGFDCSGFTSWAWGQAGYSLPHSAAAQGAMVRRLPLSQLLPGDLVFYGFGYVHHVALYIGGGSIVHAPGSGRHVRVDSIYYWDDLHWAGRLP
jgi:cell wall-associated NlpC family hydrolase